MAQEKELTLEEALAKIAEQQTEIAGLNTRVEELEGETAEQQTEIEGLNTRVEELEEEQGESTGIISDLQEQLANAEASQAVSETVVVTHTDEAGTKEQYKVVLPKFKHKGQSYVSADLKTNSALVKELVEGGKGVLVKLEKATPAKASAKAATAKKDASK
jgi:chromosome segregation ATPase